MLRFVIYYNHRNKENLIAEFHASQAGLSYSDIHLTIPFEYISALKESDSDDPSIVYDIDTGDQKEHLEYDNEGLIEIENTDDFFSAKAALQGTPVLLRLKQGWNLVADAVQEEDVYEKLTPGTIYSHDGSRMRADVPNPAFGGGYFVFLPKDMNIVLTGTPVIPDFDHLNENKWQLMGTGVDVYNTLTEDEDSDSHTYTYTPGQGCGSIYVMERDPDGETQWKLNPDIIQAGSGFWCIKEQS